MGGKIHKIKSFRNEVHEAHIEDVEDCIKSEDKEAVLDVLSDLFQKFDKCVM